MTDPEASSVFLSAALSGVGALWRLFFGPSSRTFWPYLLVSLAVAFWLWRRERRNDRPLPPHLNVFSKATWIGRSAMNDYWLVLLNAMLFGGVVAMLIPDSGLFAALFGEVLSAIAPSGFGGAPAAWAPVALALWLFVVDDFARYAGHWLEHRVPVLWEFHKVHHSAEVMNFVTAERHHPVSLVVFGLLHATLIGAANAAFLWVFGSAVTPATLLGANAFWLCGNLLASSLRHSPAWLSFGPRVERWLLSPAQHQIHHSENPVHFDANFGSTLAVWDRIFGTLYVTGPKRELLTFGLGAETSEYRSVPRLYLRPAAAATRRLVEALRSGTRPRLPLHADVNARGDDDGRAEPRERVRHFREEQITDRH